MPTLAEDYADFLKRDHPPSGDVDLPAEAEAESTRRRESKSFAREESERERQAGGAIRQAPPASRFPIGALTGGLATTLPQVARLLPHPAAKIGATALSAMLGEAGQQAVEQGMEVPGRFDLPLAERAKGVAEEGGLQAVGGFAGGQVQRMGGAIGRAIQRPVVPQAERAMQFAEQGAPLAGRQLLDPQSRFAKAPLMPSQASESPILEIVQNIAEGSLIGNPIVEGFKTRGAAAIDDTAKLFAEAVGTKLPESQLGEVIVAGIERNLDFHRKPAEVLFNQITKLTQPVQRRIPKQEVVPVLNTSGQSLLDAGGKPLTKTVTKMVETTVNPSPIDMRRVRSFAVPLGRVAKEINKIAPEVSGDSLVEQLSTLPNVTTYEAAKSLKTRLMAAHDQIEFVSRKAPALRVISRATELVDDAISRGLERFDPAVRDVWRLANRIWKGTAETYKNDLLRELIKTAEVKKGGVPAQVFDTAFRAGPDGIRRVRTALEPTSPAWHSFQRQALENLYEKAGLSPETSLIGKKLEAQLRKVGDETVQELFTPDQRHWLTEFANLAEQHQKAPKTGIGRMLIQMKTANLAVQVGAIGAAGGTGMMGTAGALILAPAMLAKLFTSPMGRTLLIRGMRTPVGNPATGEILGKLVAFIEGREPAKESAVVPRPLMPPQAFPNVR